MMVTRKDVWIIMKIKQMTMKRMLATTKVLHHSLMTTRLITKTM